MNRSALAALLAALATVVLVLVAIHMVFGWWGVAVVILIAGAYCLGLIHGTEITE